MICSGDMQQMKDKMMRQNNVLKVQKQLTADVSTELSSHLTSFQDIFSQQTTLIKKGKSKTSLSKRHKLSS